LIKPKIVGERLIAEVPYQDPFVISVFPYNDVKILFIEPGPVGPENPLVCIGPGFSMSSVRQELT
jgi:hypothetical protein